MFGVPVVDFEDVEQRFPPATHDMFVAISFKGVNKLREAKVAEAEAKFYPLTSHVSPRASVWSKLVVNPNTIIMENNVIQPFVTIGRNVIMWSGNLIGHHTRIGDNCFIASQAVISEQLRDRGRDLHRRQRHAARPYHHRGAQRHRSGRPDPGNPRPTTPSSIRAATEPARVTSDRLRSI